MMHLKQNEVHTMDTVFILMLLALFSIISVLVILSGAKQYESIADKMSRNYETRTVSAYLSEKLNQNDISGSAFVCNLAGTEALALMQKEGGKDYCTYIYAYDGYLREITVLAGTEFSPDFGQKIVETASLSITSYPNGLFCFQITDTKGNTHPLYVSLQAHSETNL